MSKTALPAIFISAVAAALFYVSQEEHGTETLLLLAAVLLVGQICATLPFILEARKPHAGTPANLDAGFQKIIANQQIIHEDLRSLGETLIKRLNAVSERQAAVEKNLLAALNKNAPDFSDELDALREKISKELEERFENLDKAVGEIAECAAPEPDTETHKKLDAITGRLDDFLEILENLSPEESDAEIADNEDADSSLADFDVFDEPENASDDEICVENFPEEPETVPAGTDENPAEQSEFELGDTPRARRATLVLDAMLPIGNKPFLRGNAPELSNDAGTPMTFVEIGKWSHDFEALSEKISVRILLNDDENQPLGAPITLAPGQTLELAHVPERA